MVRIFAAVLLWIAVSDAVACDVCGCAAGGFSTGFYAFQSRNFIGLTYRDRAFTVEHPPVFESQPAVFSHDRFQTLELSGRYMPHRNIQLMAFLPGHLFRKRQTDQTTSFSGVGDAMLLASAVVQPRDSGSSRFAYRFTLGGGLKLPTGSHDELDPESGLIIPGLQPGTGSFDFLAHTSYVQRIHRWGVLTESSLSINSTNRFGYRFGHRWSSTLTLVRWMMWRDNERFILRPSTGIAWDWSAKDIAGPKPSDVNLYSGGYFLDATVGLHFLFNSINVGCTFRHPLRQYYAEDYVQKKGQFSAQVNYLFKSKS